MTGRDREAGGDACWWCDQDDRPVLWVGEARSACGAFSTPVYACPRCLALLEERVQRHADSRYRV